ncbi:MAG: PQQ-binding-like beta-propeller repeat protein [Christensenella sp.]|nr:PQQ-binding-like beta-propeller repeat protein [Christensenella sp.]
MARKKKKRRIRMQPRFFLIMVAVLGTVIIALLLVQKVKKDKQDLLTATPVPTASAAPTATPKPALPEDITITRADSANPSQYGITNAIKVAGDDVSSFTRSEAISFPRDNEYSTLPGITTFGGNNYRNSFAYGSVTLTDKRLREGWTKAIGALGNWSGTGWTGQPLIVEWPVETVAVMNVKQSYKDAAAPLTEVIYPAMDGNIYFLDLATGAATRDPINTGIVQKGTSCLDPRGYPLLYVGQGIPVENEQKNNAAYVRVYSLISGEQIGQFGGFDWFARRIWQAYDGSPMVTDDTLVYGGENGIFYTVKLNAQFDATAGTVSIKPDGLIKSRYEGAGYSKSDTPGARWYGIESSVSAFRNYAFFTDNGGRLICVDVNTMAIKYVVDVTDESDSSVVVEESYDDNTIYLYTGSQVRAKGSDLPEGFGYSYQRKINGLTGAIVWEKRWICSTGEASASGGIVATPQVGKGQISDLVIYSFSLAAMSNGAATTEATETPNPEAQATGQSAAEGATGTQSQSEVLPQPDADGGYSIGGRIVAYDKSTGNIVWSVEQTNDYWASPVVVYDGQGKGYLIQCDRGGYVTLYDASSGIQLNSMDIGSRIDSTPAVFNNMLVVGTRGKGGSGKGPQIVCLKIS